MKRTFKTILVVILFLVVIPAVAGWVAMALWNCIIAPVCGFAEIGFWQGIGLFFLGQILTGGFVLGLFLAGGAVHATGRGRHGAFKRRWHSMTDEQRRDFMTRRRERFGFRRYSSNRSVEDAAE